MDHFESTLIEPHISTRSFRGILTHFREAHGDAVVRDAVERSGLTLDYLEDTENWVSAEYSERLSLALIECAEGVRDDPPYGHPVWQHWRRAGHLSTRRDVFGPLWLLARALGSPTTLFRALPRLARHANRVSRWELVSHNVGSAVLRVVADDGAPPDRPEYCWSRVGIFEIAPTLWGLPRARIEHPRCAHHAIAPAKDCVYVIQYQPRVGLRLLRSVLIVATFAALGLWAGATVALPSALAGALLGALGGLAIDGWWSHLQGREARFQDAGILHETLEESERAVGRLWEERQALRRLLMANQKISAYLDPAIVSGIMEDPETALVLGGRRVHAAIVFMDIVGYTRRCEGRAPELVVRELNELFARIDPIIERHGGILDKRIGDAIMVVFVAQSDERHSDPVETRALACAVDMLRAIDGYNQDLAAEHADPAAPAEEPIAIRVGVAAGPVVQGNVGSPLRYEYTVIGDVVNLAARLQSRATPGRILTQRSLKPHLPPTARRLRSSTIAVRGRKAEVDSIELVPAD